MDQIFYEFFKPSAGRGMDSISRSIVESHGGGWGRLLMANRVPLHFTLPSQNDRTT